MMILLRVYMIFCTTILVMTSTALNATILTFDDPLAFVNEVNRLGVTRGPEFINFDNLDPDTPLPSGMPIPETTTISVTPIYRGPDPDINFKVANMFDTTTGINYLGLNNLANFDQFIGGRDVFDLNFFPQINAIGMEFIVSDPLLPGDIRLISAGVQAVNTSRQDRPPLPDGGLVYFIGLINSEASVNNALIRFPSTQQAFLFNVDNIYATKVVSVSEPSSLLLLAIGALGLIVMGLQNKGGAPIRA